MVQPVLIDGQWRASQGRETFRAENPAAGEPLTDAFPISDWRDCELALDAAAKAFEAMRAMPVEKIAGFLNEYATAIEARAAELVAIANAETGLAVAPRLKDVELPRTTGQLRQAAAAAREIMGDADD